MKFPVVPMRRFLRQRSEFVEIDDAVSYRRPRVQLHGRGIVLRDTVFGSEIRTKRQQVLRDGDFIVAEIDAKVGGFGVVPRDFEGSILSSHYYVYDVDESVVLRGWLKALVVSGLLEGQVKARGSTNYAAIRPGDVLDLEVPLPADIGEQRRVVARLDAVAMNLEALKAERSGAAVTCASLWRAASSERIERSRAPVKQLGAVLKEIRGGGTPSKSDPRYWDGSIPWISPKDMKTRKVTKAQDYISEDATVETPAHLIEPGAVLVVVRGMILVHTVPIAVLGVPAAINQDMKALIPSREVLPEYLSTVLWAKNSELLNLVEKSTHDTRKLETEKLLAFEIPVPTSLEDQRAIVSELDKLFQRTRAVETLQKESAAIVEMLFPAVLRQAFTLQGSSNSSLTS